MLVKIYYNSITAKLLLQKNVLLHAAHREPMEAKQLSFLYEFYMKILNKATEYLIGKCAWFKRE